MVDRCLVLVKYEVRHDAVSIREKLKQLLIIYGLTNCSTTIMDSSSNPYTYEEYEQDDYDMGGEIAD